MLTGHGSIFLSKEWRFNCDRVDISLQNTGTENHNSLGIGEKYHSTMRTLNKKVAHEHLYLPRDVALALSVQAMNCKFGLHRLVPSLLVLACYESSLWVLLSHSQHNDNSLELPQLLGKNTNAMCQRHSW